MSFHQFTLKTFTTRGQSLTPLELKDHVPFTVARVYWVTKPAENSNTGQHCHFVEEEVFVCVAGTMTAVIDRGARGGDGARAGDSAYLGREYIPLAAGDALYVPHHVWHGFENLSPDAVLLALSSTNYSADRHDYCEDYDAWQEKYRAMITT